LSDLHQLRGRVGRSNKKAFCYLLAPPLSVVTPEARRRLRSIEEFSELGSGFNIAMQDLDIRGAGNLLGAEQSGFIADIGFETYHRILDEAINELKETEFKNLFDEEKMQESGKVSETRKKKFVKDCYIDTDLEIMYPDDYIPNIAERIRLYRELNNISTEQNLEQFESRLKDRFGSLPEPAVELLNIVRLRWLAEELGFEKIFLQNKKMLVHFISNPESPYFKSPLFINILQFVQNNPQQFIMKEKSDKLTLTMLRVNNIRQAINLLKQINK
jgi:transcription-repair coupling factor (superfamily II helicase)